MKKRFSLLVLSVCIITFALTLLAQEATPEAVFVPDDFVEVLVQQAESGTLTQNDTDTTYTLTLIGLGGEFLWFIESPWLDAGTEAIVPMVHGWQSAEGLVAESAVLHVGDVSVVLALTAPEYDETSDTLTYTATITQLIARGDADAKTPPETFDSATLFIRFDAAFMQTMVDSLIALGDSARTFTEMLCIMGRCG